MALNRNRLRSIQRARLSFFALSLATLCFFTFSCLPALDEPPRPEEVFFNEILCTLGNSCEAESSTVPVTPPSPPLPSLSLGAQMATIAPDTYSFSKISVAASGDVYVVGSQTGSDVFEYGPSVSVAGSFSGGSNAVIIKYNAAGVAQWARSVASATNTSSFSGVAVDSAGNVFAVGAQKGSAPFDYGNGAVVSGAFASDNNPLIVKYDSAGNALWAKSSVAANKSADFRKVAVDSSGNAYVIGYQQTSAAVNFGNSVIISTSSALDHGIIVKYNAAGVAQWCRVNQSSYGTTFYGIAVDTNSVYVAGWGPGNSSHTYSADFGGVSVSGGFNGLNAILIKFDSAGTALWATSTVMSPYATYFESVAVDLSGGYVYAVGSLNRQSSGSFTFGPPNQTVTAPYIGGYNSVIVKYDVLSGDAIWARTLSSASNTSSFNNVVVDSLGKIYVVGSQTGSSVFNYDSGITVTSPYSGGGNAVVVEYDPSGTALAAKTMTVATNTSSLGGIAISPGGKILVSGGATGNGSFAFDSGDPFAGQYSGGTNGFWFEYQ